MPRTDHDATVNSLVNSLANITAELEKRLYSNNDFHSWSNYVIQNSRSSVVLDLHSFRLSEMSVKLVDGSVVVVEAKHDERQDEEFGAISRHFLHKYRLPSDIDPSSLISDLSDKGILTITARKRKHTAYARTIPIFRKY